MLDLLMPRIFAYNVPVPFLSWRSLSMFLALRTIMYKYPEQFNPLQICLFSE